MYVTVNNRTYRTPEEPILVACVDGLAPHYIQHALDAGAVPFLASLGKKGGIIHGTGAMPSFTNPNNVSIITGVSPAEHGMPGNFFYDSEQREEVMMNKASFLRCETILSAFARYGKRVAAITVKDKLREMLTHGLPMGENIFVSIEKYQSCTQAHNGLDTAQVTCRDVPDFYSTEASMAAFDVAIALVEQRRSDVIYVSTSDYIQHMYAPEEAESLRFMAELDACLQRLDALGCTFVLTADHGMSAKTDFHGTANILYLQTVLDAHFGESACRVLLPITDPYVKHHGSLGSFATVYVNDASLHHSVYDLLQAQDVLTHVFDTGQAARIWELPPDRIGDFCVVSQKDFVIGKRPQDHDLEQLKRPLRSHGGLIEQRVPVVSNKPFPQDVSVDTLRSFDAFYLACNTLVATQQAG